MEQAYHILGLKKKANAHEINRAFRKAMNKIDDEHQRLSDERSRLTDAYNTLCPSSNNLSFFPIRSFFDEFFSNHRFPTLDDNDHLCESQPNGYYYAKESMSTVRDGKIYRKVRENNNGQFREFEEHQDARDYQNINLNKRLQSTKRLMNNL